MFWTILIASILFYVFTYFVTLGSMHAGCETKEKVKEAFWVAAFLALIYWPLMLVRWSYNLGLYIYHKTIY